MIQIREIMPCSEGRRSEVVIIDDDDLFVPIAEVIHYDEIPGQPPVIKELQESVFHVSLPVLQELTQALTEHFEEKVSPQETNPPRSIRVLASVCLFTTAALFSLAISALYVSIRVGDAGYIAHWF
jgi:hypothetical protein